MILENVALIIYERRSCCSRLCIVDPLEDIRVAAVKPILAADLSMIKVKEHKKNEKNNDFLVNTYDYFLTNRSVDCWALGVLTFEFTAGYTPFQPPGEPSDMTALFTRIAGSKITSSTNIFPPTYDKKVRNVVE